MAQWAPIPVVPFLLPGSSILPEKYMEKWKWLVKESITRPEDLAAVLDVDVEEIKRVSDEFPLRITPYYLSLIREKGDPIWKQVIPDIQELSGEGCDDPLHEESDSPVTCITHRYPDRALFYVSATCALYCRFCTRKRKVSDPKSVSDQEIQNGIDYIKNHREIRDVIVSGGDPFMLSDEKIDSILGRLRALPHVQIVRIGTRVPVTLPQRITEQLCAILEKYHPLFINTHFNHPREITQESRRACGMLASAGIPLGNQSVLLRGVNDSPKVMKQLVHKLLTARVRPYYIYQADLVRGTEHFRTSIKKGLEIIRSLRGFTSGLAIPHYVIDAPGGGGKIALIPNPVIQETDDEIILKNFEGNLYKYPTKVRNENKDPEPSPEPVELSA
jgi:lysine 2,3-aminomutase